MSLVEQAARKLEQLRKAGAEVAGDLAPGAEPTSAAPARESTIERAARKLESLDAKRVTLDLRRAHAPEAPTAPPASAEPGLGRVAEAAPEVGLAPAARTGAEDMLEWGEQRHEPTLGDTAQAEMEIAQPPGPTPLAMPAADRPVTIEVGPPRPQPALELDLERLTTLGVLTPDRTDSDLANQLRLIKRPLIRAAQGKTPRPVTHGNRIMVTSALSGEGKSFIALNIAMSIAMERDSRVLLIDADTTRPSLSAILDSSLSQGLLDLVTNPALSPGQTLRRTNIERLTFLPAGTLRQNATELLASEAMERLVTHLASRYPDRILIFDAPPLLAAPEPPVLAGYMGQIVVVVEAQRTTHKAAQQALAAVENCPVVMTVLNKCATPTGGRHYYT